MTLFLFCLWVEKIKLIELVLKVFVLNLTQIALGKHLRNNVKSGCTTNHLNGYFLLLPSLSSSPLTYFLTRHCIMPTLQSLKSGSSDENSEFLKIKIAYCYNDQSLANLNGITNWGQSKLPKLMELQEMGLARSQNIFKMVRQILYEADH